MSPCLLLCWITGSIIDLLLPVDDKEEKEKERKNLLRSSSTYPAL
jgi:hypothetical protein